MNSYMFEQNVICMRGEVCLVCVFLMLQCTLNKISLSHCIHDQQYKANTPKVSY